MMRPRVHTLPPFHLFIAEVLGLDVSSRRGHIVISKALDGLPMNGDELALFRRYTGREQPRAGGYPYVLTLTGRQSGKTEQAGARLVHAAVASVLRGDHDVACVGISQDQRAAQRVLFTYVQRFFESPLLRGLVVSQTADTITLEHNVRILVLPCRPAAIRGLRCALVVLDEVAHFRNSENLPLDREAWRAALPTLLTTGGKLVALSSPYVAAGLAFDLHRHHYGRDGDVLVWQSPSVVLHPGLSESALAQIRDVDPDGAEAEIEGQFLQSIAALLDEETLAAAVDVGVTVRPRMPGIVYSAHVDVATGQQVTGDRWTCAVGHREKDTAVLDAVLLIKPPFSTTTAAEQTAALCRDYGVRSATSDKFAQGFSHEAFARAGLRLDASDRNKSEFHLDFAAALSSGRARLLDDPELLKELRALERKRGATRDRVQSRRGIHDDVADVVAGVLTRIIQKPRTDPAVISKCLSAGSRPRSDPHATFDTAF
jgi:hypothetical protein